MENNTLIDNLSAKAKSMRQTLKERGWERIGIDIKRYIVPDRGRLLDVDNDPKESNDYDKGDRAWVVDDTGEQANNFFVSGLISMLTPETSPWFKLDVSDPAIKDSKRVKVWLDDVTALILRVFSDSDTYSALKSVYTEFASFGTGAMLLYSDEVETILPIPLTFGEYTIEVNPKGQVDTLCREYFMTAPQMKAQFGEENLSSAIKLHLKNHGQAERRFKVYHLIEPNDGRRKVSNVMGRPFNEFFWDEQAQSSDKPLAIGGYDEFPAMVPRWSVISTDTYGKESPGMKQLQNVKGLQSVVRDVYIISKRIGDPPLVSDANAFNISNLPGEINMVTDVLGNTSGVQPLFQNYNPRLDAIWAVAERHRELIEKGFFNDLFLSLQGLEGDRRTATEIVARNEEKFAMLGPVLNRVFNGILEPMIDRTFNILFRQGFFDEDGEYPVPPELSGTKLDIEYTSVIAQAQKAVGLNNIDRFIERFMLLMQIDPSVADNVDLDAITRKYGSNIPAESFREIEEMIAIREQRAIQQQQAEAMAQAESAAGVSKDLAGAKLQDGSSVLDGMAEEEV